MSDSLPMELILAILTDAAELFVVSDRASVCSLALTASFVRDIIRPILFRRMVVTDKNARAVGTALEIGTAGSLVLDLCLSYGSWEPQDQIVAGFTQIRCLRGYPDVMERILPRLPASAQKSLFKLQLWDDELVRNIPPSVTHVCLFFDRPRPPMLGPVESWLSALPSITHIGCELVTRRTEQARWDAPATANELAQDLQDLISAAKSRPVEFHFRLCGNISDALWAGYIGRICANSEQAGKVLQLDQRISLWRDTRIIDTLSDDLEACYIDAHAGVDVWSEARPVGELLADLNPKASETIND